MRMGTRAPAGTGRPLRLTVYAKSRCNASPGAVCLGAGGSSCPLPRTDSVPNANNLLQGKVQCRSLWSSDQNRFAEHFFLTNTLTSPWAR